MLGDVLDGMAKTSPVFEMYAGGSFDLVHVANVAGVTHSIYEIWRPLGLGSLDHTDSAHRLRQHRWKRQTAGGLSDPPHLWVTAAP
jgi:hypothetical protein